MKLTDLAQELVDFIVDALLYGDPKLLSSSTRQDLQTCLFVTPMTRYRAGRHLFRAVRISDEQDEDILISLKTLSQLLSPNTTGGKVGIASFVKELSVKFVRLDAESFLDNNEALIPQIFDALNAPQYGVSSLSLCFPPRSHGFGLNLEERPDALQKSFYELLHSPHLRFLSLENIYGLSATIIHGSQIEILRLKNTGYKDWGSAEKFHETLQAAESSRVPRGAISHLRTLDIDNAAPLLPFRFWEGLQLHQLDSFVGSIHGIAHLRNVGMVIRQAEKVKNIFLRFPVNNDVQSPMPSTPALLNLRNLSNLKHLQIVILRRTPSISMPDGIEQIAEILDVPMPPDPLITLEVKIKMPVYTDRQLLYFDLPPDPRWRKLDEILSGPNYAHLESRNFIVEVTRFRFTAQSGETTAGVAEQNFVRDFFLAAFPLSLNTGQASPYSLSIYVQSVGSVNRTRLV